jgi:hypothetical protein
VRDLELRVPVDRDFVSSCRRAGTWPA